MSVLDIQDVTLRKILSASLLAQNVLLPPSVELLDRTQFIKKLLADQPWHLQELVV